MLSFFFLSSLDAQDPFFQNFHSAQSYFNPSLVGISGSMSFQTKYRRQWDVPDPLFETTYFAIEESMPCGLLDFGFSFLNDIEGSAHLRTREFSGSIAGTIPFGNEHIIHNIRIGVSTRHTSKTIDFSRLTFSDQLDPKYGLTNSAGIPNTTSFLSPDQSHTPKFWSPSVGFSMTSVWGADHKKPFTTSIGGALNHVLSLTDNLGGIESLYSRDGTSRIPARYSLYANAEIILKNEKQFYDVITPQIFYQFQGQIKYFEIGSSYRRNRDFGVGLFLHWSPDNINQASTNSVILQLDVAVAKMDYHRIDLGINLSHNVSGLTQRRTNTIEVSFTYHLRKSPTCSLFNLIDDPATSDDKCPGWNFLNKRRYMDMWYYTQG